MLFVGQQDSIPLVSYATTAMLKVYFRDWPNQLNQSCVCVCVCMRACVLDNEQSDFGTINI